MAIIYVKSGSTGNGSAWNNAYGSLQSAITAAQAGDEIWVAAGTYKPTTGTDRTASFTLKNNVAIYGGFAGTETALNQRNIASNATILSGEIGVAGIADNSYHVVSATGTISTPLGNSSILDGFTITGGNANGTTGNQDDGGGMYVSGASPTLRNITFRDNNGVNGGALYNESGSNPVLIDTVFEYNTATTNSIIQGGGFTGATDNNPLFVNAKGDDLRLKSGSPALNAGDSKLFSSLRNALTFGLITLCITILGKNNVAQAITLTTFSPIGFSDAIAGIIGFEIEDFEDTTLTPGLSIEWTSPNLGPVNSLPTTYNPITIDGLTGNTWDGNLTLNNNRQGSYQPTRIYSTTTLHFSNQPKSVGLGISNIEFTGSNSSTLIVNGVDFADFDNFAPAPIVGYLSRSIYIRLDADNTNESINSIGIRGGSGDFLIFDRLAIKTSQTTPIPEPSTILGIVTLGLGALFSKKHKQDDNNDD
jgi:hypothetical protein